MSFALHKGLFLLRAFSSVSLFRDFHFHAIVAPHPHSISFLNCRNMLPVGSRLSHGLWRKRSISSRAAQLYNLAHSDTRPNDKSVSQQKNIFINSNIVTTKIYKESNIIRLVQNRTMSDSAEQLLHGYDKEQVKLMEEKCILVNEQDNPIGFASKRDCHLLTNINADMLHRAFSVFLFNTKGELLLQQRSNTKITFPNHWTNTCCSHPLDIPGEEEELNGLGVKRAAQRKLQQELGIRAGQSPLEDFQYLTRIHYKSDNVPHDGKFGEHEIDYILFIQRDVDLIPNSNEVQAHRYVSKQQLDELMKSSQEEGGPLITPWFRMIFNTFLPLWWNHLANLNSQLNQTDIHRLVDS